MASLPAYLTDLMVLLSTTSPKGDLDLSHSKDSEEENSAETKAKLESTQTLLDLLALRRPDLKTLDLTSENSQTTLPYFQLVNEALECFIKAKRTPSILEGPTGHASEPVDTDFDLSKQMFPFPCFPYDPSQDIVLQCCDLFELQYTDLMQTFSSPELLLNSIPREKFAGLAQESKDELVSGAAEVFCRQLAANILGLQQAEFAAITGETFFPVHFADTLQELSDEALTIDTTLPESEKCQFWGYNEEATMMDSTNGNGLTYIKSQLMPRSGLEFRDIADLKRTQLLKSYLVITGEEGLMEWTDAVEELRLMSFIPSKEPGVLVTPVPLTSQLCYLLHSFIRLQKKLRWSIKDLDAAIYCLHNKGHERTSNAEGTSNAGETSKYRNPISPYVVKGIASLVKLSKICDIEPALLLPIWGPMDSFGPNSLLRRRFLVLRPSYGGFLGPRPDDCSSFRYGPYGTKRVSLQQYSTEICANLTWPCELFGDLVKAAGLESADLDLDAFSKLYRYILVGRMLNVPPKLILNFFAVFTEGGCLDPFESPETTLAIVQKWKILLDNGWDMESLISVLGGTPSGCKDSCVADICQRLNLTTLDLTNIGAFLGMDLDRLSLEDLVKLQKFVFLRDTTTPQLNNSIMGLFWWLSNTSNADTPEIMQKIALSTGWWNTTLVNNVLIHKYSAFQGEDTLPTLRAFEAITNIQTIVNLGERIGGTFNSLIHASALIEALVTLAQPPPRLTVQDEYVKAAQVLRGSLTDSQRASMDERLRENKRQVLVAYLLQQDCMKERGIRDTGGLFEYLLVDAEIVPRLRTTRIKEAISVIQLFAQRCILGLEKGVSKTALSREKWAWMKQHTTWEAHRRSSSDESAVA